ncbi:hypothetical protein HMF8227_01636 [Saliniradius amylolyticus]|uniref:STAS domain-containing protein n=1 Tax=Saliniradius amylolyticus TaxID=2183582 RepID=A0A2S2E3D3_9ALTE|nr:hypothetical protein HMF8227_01636 [Saliniradius amylolyticus]
MNEDVSRIRLPERFDFDHHKIFSQAYKAALNKPGCASIILDFSDVDYLDSSALGLMVLLHREANSQGVSLAIEGASGVARDILNMANMQKLYDFRQ